MFRTRVRLVRAATLSAAALALTATAAPAAIMYSPAGVAVSVPQESTNAGSTGAIVNGSGLPAFTSGVTDFADYLASDPRHSDRATDHYNSENSLTTPPVVFTFDLGAPQFVRRVAIWNSNLFGYGDSGIRDFTLTVSNTADFSSATADGGTYQLAAAGNPAAVQLIDIGHTFEARYFRIGATTNQGTPGHFGLGEVVFVGPGAIPEPGAAALVAAGALALALRRRRRRDAGA